VNPQQVLPSAKVTIETETLRDLERCDDTAFDLLAALACPVADMPVFSARSIDVGDESAALRLIQVR
jgi:hypothetical protein